MTFRDQPEPVSVVPLTLGPRLGSAKPVERTLLPRGLGAPAGEPGMGHAGLSEPVLIQSPEEHSAQ